MLLFSYILAMSQNNLLMQIQSDHLGIPVLRPSMLETTALGAAIIGKFVLTYVLFPFILRLQVMHFNFTSTLSLLTYVTG